MSPGIRSGVNWTRLKLQLERLGDRLDHEGLGEPGHADEQGMAAGENGPSGCRPRPRPGRQCAGRPGCGGRRQPRPGAQGARDRWWVRPWWRSSVPDGESEAGELRSRVAKVAWRTPLAPIFHKKLKSCGYATTGARSGESGGVPVCLLGMQFAAGTLFFAGMGFLLDRWLHILPALTITGLLVGGALSFYSVYRKVMAVPCEGPQGQGRVSLLAPGAALVALVMGLLGAVVRRSARRLRRGRSDCWLSPSR